MAPDELRDALAKMDKDIERLTGLVAVLVSETTGKTPLFRELNPSTDEIEGQPITGTCHIALRPREPSPGAPACPDLPGR